jgi:membrane fusion protein, multidrug efflux system
MNPAVIGLAAFFATAVLSIAAPPAAAVDPQSSGNPSALVQLTKLRKGSLPRAIMVFGKVEASAAMKQTIMAPATAVVEALFVKPGEQVAAGAPLVQLGPTPGTAAAYEKAVSALNDAQGLAERTRSLLDQHLATRQQLADAEKSVADAQASLTALSAEGASKSQTLAAPFDAIITGVSTSLGTIVNQGAALLDLTRTSGLVFHAGAVPEQAREIHEGDAATVTALGGGTPGEGTVLLRGVIVDPQTGLVPIDITLPNGGFFAGQTAQARIVTGTVEGYIVPHEAVLLNDYGAPYVVQVPNLIAREVPVTILLSSGAEDVVTGALDPAAPLVLAGNYQLHDGMKVRVPDSAEPANK